MAKFIALLVISALSISAAMFSFIVFETFYDPSFLNSLPFAPRKVGEAELYLMTNETRSLKGSNHLDDPFSSNSSSNSSARPSNELLSVCNFSLLEEAMIRPTCSFRVCTFSGSEILLDDLFVVSDGSNAECSYGRRIYREPNLFSLQEQEAGNLTIGNAVMFPSSNFTDTAQCKEWFFSSQSLGGMEYIRKYLRLRIPTSGISTSVTYLSPNRVTWTDVNKSSLGMRYLVIYAAATVDEYRIRVSNYTLRRLRASLGQNTFIIMVEVSKSITDIFWELADVILHADFVSPDSFYDSAAMQEGMLEAFRLFGVNLFGFYGLLIMNDSIIGPISGGLFDILPKFPATEPILVAVAIWSKVIISGCGILVNRAAFTAPAFTDFWRYIRFPCGKWGAMLLWEGPLHHSLLAGAKASCFTFTNDIMAVSSSPTSWKERGLLFYKHTNSNTQDGVLRFIESRDPHSNSVDSAQSVQTCNI